MCFKFKSMPFLLLHACQVIRFYYFKLHKNGPLLKDVISVLLHDTILLCKYVCINDKKKCPDNDLHFEYSLRNLIYMYKYAVMLCNRSLLLCDNSLT